MKPADLRAAWSSLTRLPDGRGRFAEVLSRAVPYSGTIEPLVLELRPGFARVQIEDRPAVRNHLDSVHAIAVTSLGELAAGLAAVAAIPDGGRGIVLELHASFLKKARGTLTAEARVEVPTAPGEHDFAADATVTDPSGEVVARVRALWRVEVPLAV